ncbi:BnaCnng46540D [Brassica napus]|uniref:BnaCnng46540D protein n=1 Tax=Brassica napus TaxID=3708 RepID=A0A078JHX6_BRANA|nr:BnaCnng46540D [Brassica napus]
MDMISQLSDDLLIRILSLVPTKHVMATCCLSKRWLLFWSLVPKLEYDDSSYSDENYATFTKFVYGSLMSNKAPVLESLTLTLGPNFQAIDVGIWIETAVCHRVHAIIVNTLPYEEKGTMISLPSSIYTCETLETLELSGCFCLNDIPFSVCLPSLKTLEIINVEVSSLTRLLSGCPNLDHLVVHREDIDVDIVVPSLRKLNMVNYTGGQKGSGFVIDARSLVSLYIKDDVFNDYHRIEYMPKLEEAYVDITCGVRDHKFLKAFTCARALSLCLSFLEVLSPRSMIFHNLVYLTLNTCVHGWWDLVTHMLQDSPKLRFLKLHDVR